MRTLPEPRMLKGVPSGIRQLLHYLQTTYTGPKGKDIVLSQFGFADQGENNFTNLPDMVYDQLRVDYFMGYLNKLLMPMFEVGVNVTQAVSWGIFHKFEWASGSSTKVWLQNVNYTTLTRTPKASLFTSVEFFEQHGV